MEINTRDLFLRWLTRSQANVTEYSILCTACLMLDEHSELAEQLGGNPVLIDSTLVDSILKVASPIEVACVLWSPIGQALDHTTFSKWVNFAWSAGRDFRTQHYLGGAIRDYLRHNPGAIEPPGDLVEALMAAPLVEAHVIGAKLAGEVFSDFGQVWTTFAAMLLEGADEEQLAVLFVLVEELHRHLVTGRSRIGFDLRKRIRSTCDQMKVDDAPSEISHMRQLVLDKIDEVESESKG